MIKTAFFVAVFAFASVFSSHSESPFERPSTDDSLIEKHPCGVTNTTFNPNEKLRYQAYYNWNFVWVKAGYVDFSTQETTYAGQPSYLLKAVGRTHSSHDHFYRVRDYYQSYVDKNTMKPIKYLRNTNQGGYTTYEELRFDHNAGKVASKKGKTKETAKDKEFTVGGCMHDVVSILYYVRNLDFSKYEKGDKIPIQVFFEEKYYDLYVKYLGIETVKVKRQGKFRCHKVSPLLIAGDIFKETNRMVVWITDDENKIPVMIETPVRVGSIKATIAGSENLKYPVKAKVK